MKSERISPHFVVRNPPTSAPKTVKAIPRDVETRPTSFSERPRSIQKGLIIGVIAWSPSLYRRTNAIAAADPGRDAHVRSGAKKFLGRSRRPTPAGARRTTSARTRRSAAAAHQTGGHHTNP